VSIAADLLRLAVVDPPDAWRQRPVELAEPVRPEALHRLQQSRGVREQVVDVYSLAGGGEGSQIVGAASQHVHSPMVVLPLHVMEGHPDLKDALVERPDRTWFVAPEVFEGLVLVEVIAAVELINTASQ
jgi:hypothetical protein